MKKYLSIILVFSLIINAFFIGIYCSQRSLYSTMILQHNEELKRLNDTVSHLKSKILENETIQIGVTARDYEDYNNIKALFEQIVQKEVNNYTQSLNKGTTIKFIVKNNGENVTQAIQNIQGFKKMGVNLVIGHSWSSLCYQSMPFVKNNNMLLFSPYSSSTQLSVIGDNLLRLSPDDSAQFPAIAQLMHSLGIDTSIVLQLDAIGQGSLFDAFEREFVRLGGGVSDRVLYTPDELDGSHVDDFMVRVNDAASDAVEMFGAEHVAVLLTGSSESSEIVSHARFYPLLYNLTWFGIDWVATSAEVKEALSEVSHLRFYGLKRAPYVSPIYSSLNKSYSTMTNVSLSFEMANRYDIAWILVKSIIEADSADPSRLVAFIPNIASKTFGASGWCTLNDAGDRKYPNYEIYLYENSNSTDRLTFYGFYDGANQKILMNK